MAIKLLKQIELEKRTATPEEQIILARYVGWGGLANAFSSTASGWENEYQELKSLLTDVEYKAAMNSTITAYYTEPDLIRYIYRALERLPQPARYSDIFRHRNPPSHTARQGPALFPPVPAVSRLRE